MCEELLNNSMRMQPFRVFYTESYQKYSISASPIVLFYDFYILSYIASLNIDTTSRKYAGSFLGNGNELKAQIQEAEQKILPSLKRKLLYCIEKNIKVEIGYVSHTTILRGEAGEAIRRKDANAINRIFTDPKNVLLFAKTTNKSKLLNDVFMRAAHSIFLAPGWDANYGGNKWADIVEGYNKLAQSNTKKDIYVAIDHAFDLQHNNGSVLEPCKEFRDEQLDYAWLQHALNKKSGVANIGELFKHASSDMKKLAYKVLKFAGTLVSTVDEYDQKMMKAADNHLDELIKKSYIKNNEQLSFARFLQYAGVYLSSHTPGMLPENIKQYIVKTVENIKSQKRYIASWLINFINDYQSNKPFGGYDRFVEVEQFLHKNMTEVEWERYKRSTGFKTK